MLREWVVTGLVALTLLGCVMMLLPVLGLLHQLRMHLSLRDRGLALERERLSRPLPPDAVLPPVAATRGLSVFSLCKNAATPGWISSESAGLPICSIASLTPSSTD